MVVGCSAFSSDMSDRSRGPDRTDIALWRVQGRIQERESIRNHHASSSSGGSQSLRGPVPGARPGLDPEFNNYSPSRPPRPPFPPVRPHDRRREPPVSYFPAGPASAAAAHDERGGPAGHHHYAPPAAGPPVHHGNRSKSFLCACLPFSGSVLCKGS